MEDGMAMGQPALRIRSTEVTILNLLEKVFLTAKSQRAQRKPLKTWRSLRLCGKKGFLPVGLQCFPVLSVKSVYRGFPLRSPSPTQNFKE
jgi:hypothetical protein